MFVAQQRVPLNTDVKLIGVIFVQVPQLTILTKYN